MDKAKTNYIRKTMKKKWIKRNSQKRSRKMAIKRGWHIVIVYKYINQFFQRKIPSRNGLKLSHWLRPGGVVALRNLIRRISRTYQWITSKRLYKIQAKKGIQSCQRNKKAGSYFQEKKIRMTIQLGLFCNIQMNMTKFEEFSQNTGQFLLRTTF